MPNTTRSRMTTPLAVAAFAALAGCATNRNIDPMTDTAAGTVAPSMDSTSRRVTRDTTMPMAMPMARDTAMAAPSGGAMTGAMGGTLADPSTGPQIDSVVTAARGGLTSLAPSVAVPLIQRLEGKLKGSSDPALTDIGRDLEALRTQLQGGAPNGTEIASILERVGPKVTSVAENAGPMAASLRELGTQLGRAATQLRTPR